MFNGTALDGEDFTFNHGLEAFTLGVGDSITFEIDILADMICDYEEKTFRLMIFNQRGALVSHDGNDTIDFTIAADDQCGEYHISRLLFFGATICVYSASTI